MRNLTATLIARIYSYAQKSPNNPQPQNQLRRRLRPKRAALHAPPNLLCPSLTPNPKPSGAPQLRTLNLPSALVEEFRAQYPFALDPFQEEAIAHLATGESVMVAAPTGTGKTVVAEFGVFRARRKGVQGDVHHADQGPLQPEIPRPARAVTATQSASSQATS